MKNRTADWFNGQPFVLLDDARAVGAAHARLFVDPQSITVARQASDIPTLVGWLEAESNADDAILAGYLSYEAGKSFEPRLPAPDPAPDTAPPLGWFARFARMELIAPDDIPSLLPDPAGAWCGPAKPHITRADYDTAIAKILHYIAQGDIYQANFTFQSTVEFGGHPLALYARLRARQCAGYGGIIYTGTHWILSFSPELFVSQRGASIMARPMKGTAARASNPAQDAANAANLSADPKQRAENLMIVDLIRNDLSRVAIPGSVTVPDLFHVEPYPTVHQMVSSVRATLQPNKNFADVLRAAFPCGSITGAPKIRAMEIIDEVETEPRGIYTGSIGYMKGRQEAAFNVAIRTLVIAEGAQSASLGLGSGIVADSVAGAEWEECLIKGRFVESADAFDLLETMGFDPDIGILRLERHLARLKASAVELGFAYNHHQARNELQAATFRLRAPARIRLMLSRRGSIAIEVGPIPTLPPDAIAVKILPLPVDASDWRLRHKSTNRRFYDDARRGTDRTVEVLFETPDGQLTEGSFTSLFVERDGILLTPSLDTGLLPGTLRAELIDEGKAREATLTRDDLNDGFYVGNSLRGLMKGVLG